MTPAAPPRGDAAGSGPLALLCFGGDLPLRVAESARARGHAPFLVGFRGLAAPSLESYPHDWVRLGQVGRLVRLLRRRAIRRIAIIGAVTRPSWRDLRIDWTGLMVLFPALRMLRRGGDDHVLRSIISYFESRGLEVVGVADIAPDLLAGAGRLGRHDATADERANARTGFALLEAVSAFDVGQACIVLDGRPVAVEGAEGTDGAIERVRDLRAAGRLRVHGRRGVLVKAAKRGQDLRVDLPTIGPRTIELAAAAQLAGVAVEADHVLIANRAECLALADRLGLFVIGVARP